jgi:DNA-binding MarR family transcriptional regulator
VRPHVQIVNIKAVERHVERDLEILTAIGEGRPLTQRDLAQRLGVALGLANLYLKRLALKGFIKITDFPRKPAAGKRLRYLLTPKGLTEKSRLTYEHIAYSLHLYRRARQTLRESLSRLPKEGLKRIALYGTGEAAELAYLTLKELGLEPLGVFTRGGGGNFLGFQVRSLAEIADENPEAIILASFERPEPLLAEVSGLALPTVKILTLRRPVLRTRANGDGA